MQIFAFEYQVVQNKISSQIAVRSAIPLKYDYKKYNIIRNILDMI